MSNPNLKAGPGRAKGSKNKINRDICATLDAIGCDPAIGLAQIAMDLKIRPDVRERAYSNLMKYVYPAKKEIEVVGDQKYIHTFKWEEGEK